MSSEPCTQRHARYSARTAYFSVCVLLKLESKARLRLHAKLENSTLCLKRQIKFLGDCLQNMCPLKQDNSHLVKLLRLEHVLQRQRVPWRAYFLVLEAAHHHRPLQGLTASAPATSVYTAMTKVRELHKNPIACAHRQVAGW